MTVWLLFKTDLLNTRTGVWGAYSSKHAAKAEGRKNMTRYNWEGYDVAEYEVED